MNNNDDFYEFLAVITFILLIAALIGHFFGLAINYLIVSPDGGCQ